MLTDVHHFCLVNLGENQEHTKFKLSHKSQKEIICLYRLEKRYLLKENICHLILILFTSKNGFLHHLLCSKL